MNRNRLIVVCFVLLVIVCFCYQYKQLFSFPTHIHAWSLTDRYAIALGFINNGFDFFHPQTFVLNHQFPGEFRIPADQTITPVDFPINEFVVALIMSLLQIKQIAVYKLYIFFYSLLGFWFLYKLSYLKLKSELLSFFVLFFALSSPVYMYYQTSTIPTVTGISNVFIGLYFYLKYKRDHKNKQLVTSVIFFTLATLSRTPFVIFLLSISLVEMLPGIFSRKINLKSLFCFLASGSLIIGYFLYNSYLGKTYGTIYLNYIMPAQSWEHAKEIFEAIYHNWSLQYFTGYHYMVLIIVIILTIFSLLKRKRALEKAQLNLSVFVLWSLFFALAYTSAMFWQFQNHDYYFLDTFFIPLVLILIVGLAKSTELFQARKMVVNSVSLVLLLLSFLMFGKALTIQDERRNNDQDAAVIAVKEYNDAGSFLEKNKVKNADRILVIGSPAPNLPFIFMNKTGFVIMDPVKEKIEESLSWEFDYVVIQQSNLEMVMKNYPELDKKLTKLDGNGLINLYTRQ